MWVGVLQQVAVSPFSPAATVGGASVASDVSVIMATGKADSPLFFNVVSGSKEALLSFSCSLRETIICFKSGFCNEEITKTLLIIGEIPHLPCATEISRSRHVTRGELL